MVAKLLKLEKFMAKFEEFSLQRAVFEKLEKLNELGMINLEEITYIVSPNRFHSAKETALYKMHGYRKGQPDAIFHTLNGDFAVEFKSKKGGLTKEQIEYKAKWEKLGKEFVVIESVQSFLDILFKYKVIKEVSI